ISKSISKAIKSHIQKHSKAQALGEDILSMLNFIIEDTNISQVTDLAGFKRIFKTIKKCQTEPFPPDTRLQKEVVKRFNELQAEEFYFFNDETEDEIRN
ncbi:30673_t:CDS:2, partial [Gigaspora margarita]